MGSQELVLAVRVGATTGVVPVGDRFLEVVTLELLVRPVLDGSLDGHVEDLPSLHKDLADLIGLVGREARDSTDEQLRVRENGLAISALEENSLFRKTASAGSIIETAVSTFRKINGKRWPGSEEAMETWEFGKEHQGADVSTQKPRW